MIQDHLQVLISILQESCSGGKVIDRGALFSKFEAQTQSGIESVKFKKSLSFLINNRIIIGYDIKPGRNGGVFRVEPSEQISITCSSGKFVGEISRKELSRILASLKKARKISHGNKPERTELNVAHRSRC